MLGAMQTAPRTPPAPYDPAREPDRRVPVRLVAQLFPISRHGQLRRPRTIARYIRDGIVVGDGEVVRLEGGADPDMRRWWTTAAAVDRFLRELTAARLGVPLPAASSRPASAARAEFERLRRRKG